MDSPQAFYSEITKMSNAYCFNVRFRNVDDAVSALNKLPFVDNMRLPPHIKVGVYPTDEGALAIIGGSMTPEERLATFDIMEKHGTILDVAIPAGAEPLRDPPLSEATEQAVEAGATAVEATGTGASAVAATGLSEEAQALMDRGLKLIEGSVRYHTWGVESESGEPVEAAKLFGEAAALHPDNPLLSYLEISAYAIGMQGKTAEEKLEEHLRKHPDDLRGSVMNDSWKGIFHYPPYTLGERPPAAIDERVKQSLVLMTRMGCELRPVLFSRQDPSQVSGTLPPETPVFVHPLLVDTPHGPVMAAVAAIGDNPKDPLRAESLIQPFDGDAEPIHSVRVRFLLRCDRVPVVILSPSSKVLLAKDAPVGRKCREQRGELEQWFLKMKPREMPQPEFIAAIQHYQSVVPIERFGLEDEEDRPPSGTRDGPEDSSVKIGNSDPVEVAAAPERPVSDSARRRETFEVVLGLLVIVAVVAYLIYYWVGDETDWDLSVPPTVLVTSDKIMMGNRPGDDTKDILDYVSDVRKSGEINKLAEILKTRKIHFGQEQPDATWPGEIIIRADGDVPYWFVHKLLNTAEANGYPKFRFEVGDVSEDPNVAGAGQVLFEQSGPIDKEVRLVWLRAALTIHGHMLFCNGRIVSRGDILRKGERWDLDTLGRRLRVMHEVSGLSDLILMVEDKAPFRALVGTLRTCQKQGFKSIALVAEHEDDRLNLEKREISVCKRINEARLTADGVKIPPPSTVTSGSDPTTDSDDKEGQPVGVGRLGTRGRGGKYGNEAGVVRIRKQIGRKVILSIGRPDIKGSLSREVIRRVIYSHRDQVKYCYSKELPSNPNLSGKVSTKFIISPKGYVTQATISATTLHNKAVERCLAGKIRTWKFPEPKCGGIVIVNYPFIFNSK
jgi:biopolymer transport protein ExbD